MENGESLLDVIDETSELFGNNDIAFNLADEILAENEADITGSVATEHGNLATSIIPTNVIMTSQNYITSSNPSQTFTIASQHPFLSSTATNNSDLQQQHGASLVGQTVINPVQNVAQSVATQLFQQGNQQFILKTAGGQLQLTTQGQLQFQQPVIQAGIHTGTGQFQQHMAQSNRQSPALSASPMQNRSLTPSSVTLPVSFVGTPSSQSVSQLKSASPAPNVNILHLPQNIQQTQPQLQLAPGTVLQIPGTGGSQNLVNANLIQGLSAQQQGTLVNTQNTVIQNPNVVNLNVAHHMPLGVQTAPQAPFNIQGTLIQTPEGKSILIPSQNLAQAVNIQPLGQLSLPAQAPQTQNPNTVANMIKLQAAQGAERSNQGISQLVLNHQGQQVLIQRAPSASGQPQNIVVRSLPQSNIVQLQQTPQRTVQASTTLQAVGGQGQQLKLIQQGTSQGGSGVSVNIGGQNVNLGQLSLQNLQLVQGNTAASTAMTQPEQATSQHQVTFQQGQGHDFVATQQRQTMTSQTPMTQQNILTAVQQQQTLLSNSSQSQSDISNAANIAAQNYKGLSNMQQLMQKLRGTKQTVADSSSVQTPSSQPFLGKVTTVAPNVNIFQIKQEKSDSSGAENKTLSSSGPNTIKSLILQKQPGTLGTARVIVKQEPVIKMEPSSPASSSCGSASQAATQSSSRIENLLLSTSSAFTTAHVTAVTTTISQSVTMLPNNLVSNSVQQTVSSVDIKPFIGQSHGQRQPSGGSSFVNTSQTAFNFAQSSSSGIVSALNSSNVSLSVTSTTNSLSGNLSSISPQESTTSVTSQTNTSVKPAGGATLQTIHLPPELQQSFQRVQAKIREVNSMKNISSVERQNKLQQLNMIQRKILQRGRVLATTRAEPHHIQRGLQVLASPSGERSNDSNQLSTSTTQSTLLQSLSLDHQSSSTGKPSIQPGQQPVVSEQQPLRNASPHSVIHGQQSVNAGHQPSSGNSFLAAVDQSLQSNQSTYIPQSVVSSSQKSSSDLFSVSKLNQSQATSSSITRSTVPSVVMNLVSSLPSAISSDHHTPSSSADSSVSGITPGISNSSMTSVVATSNLPVVIDSSNMTESSTSSSMTQETSSGQMLTGQSQSLTTDSGALPVADTNKAVPTQIKIANKVLTLNLTKQQKDKVQSYLDRMTPEQQQQYLQTQQGILHRIQRQQELNSQIQAQVEAQKLKQQQNLQQTSSQKLVIPTQKTLVSGKPVEAPTSSATQPLPEVKAIPVPTSMTVNKLSTTETMLRGQKRTLMDIPKGTLINQQLRQDQNLAVNPDVKRPFRSTSDACRRLLRYHVFQSHGPSDKEFQRFDGYMEDIASDLLRKKDRMLDKFRVLMLQESTRKKPSAELVMLQRLQNQELKKLLEEEKQIAKNDPDSFIPMPMKYLISDSDGDTADEDIKHEPDSSDLSPCKTDITGDRIKTEAISDTETSNEPDYKKMKTLVIRLDSRLNFKSSFKRNSLESRSSLEGSETVETDSAKDHVDTSQDSDNEDADSVKTEIVDGEYVQEEVVQDDMIEEEIVSDFNTSESATDPRTDYPKPLIRTKASYKHFDSEPSQMLVEDESSKAVMSISSVEEPQTDDGYDESAENSQNISPPVFSQYAGKYEHHGNTEITGESLYFNQAQSDLNAVNSTNQFSDSQAVKQTSKYIPEHSPVSNDSFDNDNANSASEFGSSGYFDNFKMYQPITESLTDSEENSYYSADNTVEQNSVTVDEAENENVPWNQPGESSQMRRYSDSEHSEDSDPEVKAQMESAINSILSLNQGAPSENNPTNYNFSHSNQMLTSMSAYGNDTGGVDSQPDLRMSEIDTEVSDDGTVADDDDDVVIVGDDIDAAVQSILM